MTSLIQKTDFPIFDDEKLIYLDSASTSQKPKIVLDTIKKAYESSNANVHRALYDLGSRSTELYESSREIISDFINAHSSKEVIFTGGVNVIIIVISFSPLSSFFIFKSYINPSSTMFTGISGS